MSSHAPSFNMTVGPATVMMAAAYAAVVSVVAGWLLGARVGDTRGVIGYALSALCLAAGLTYVLGV